MAATTWIGTPKALYRMALRGGDDWNRLKDGLRADQRKELDWLAQLTKTLNEELTAAKDAEERKGTAREERRRLRKPWEEARQIALDPPEAFLLAKELVDIVQDLPMQKFRTKELATELDVDVNSPDFLEAVEESVSSGFVEWTTFGKVQAVDLKSLRARGMVFDQLDSSLAKMRARLNALGVAPLWMLHENASAESTPTKLEGIMNQLLLRLDGLSWAGPGIVSSSDVDLESLEVEKVWPPPAEAKRGSAEIEQELAQAKRDLQVALKAAASDLWARGETSASREDVTSDGSSAFAAKAAPDLSCPECGEVSASDAAFCTYCGASLKPVRNCQSCGAERRTDGNFCPDCGTEYVAEPASETTDRRQPRLDSPDPQPIPVKANGSPNKQTGSGKQTGTPKKKTGSGKQTGTPYKKTGSDLSAELRKKTR